MRGFVAALVFIQSSVAVAGSMWSHNNEAAGDFVREMKRATDKDPSLRDDVVTNSKVREQFLKENLLSKAIRAPDSKANNESPRLLDENGSSGMSAFNASSFSFKYVGCSVLSAYSEDLAAAESYSVLETKPFVSFRLCPSNLCSDESSMGCSVGYGDYLVPMYDYLEAISLYQQQELQMYCSYCEQCMYFENYFYGNRKLQNHACKYYETCANYVDSCVATDDDANNYKYQSEYENYFECQKFNSAETGIAYYVGPHCGQDRVTIGVGVFSDEYCTDYVGDQVDFYSLTGVKLDSMEMTDYSSGKCVSCSPTDNPYNIPNDGNYDNSVLELCATLYESSATCDDRIFEDVPYENEEVSVSYEASYNQTSDSQRSPEANSCSYIEKVSKGQYDDYGVVHLDGENSYIFVHDSTYVGKANRVMYDLNKASNAQIYALSFLAMGCVALVIAAIVIHQQFPGPNASLMADIPGRFRAPAKPTVPDRDDNILQTRSLGSADWA